MKDVITKYQFKKGLNHEFEILDTSELFQSNKELMTKPHRAQFYQILWNVKAKGNHIIDFNPLASGKPKIKRGKSRSNSPERVNFVNRKIKQN